MRLTSPAFDDGGRIPREHGYTERNARPPLAVSDVPPGTATLALVMDDPDAVEPAGKVWDHWVVWNIPADTRRITADMDVPGVEGTNDYGEVGYGGPNPPDREHTYVFTLYALDTTLDLEPGATTDDLEQAMQGHILASTELHGTYAP